MIEPKMKLLIIHYFVGDKEEWSWGLAVDGSDEELRNQARKIICEDNAVEMKDWSDYGLELIDYYAQEYLHLNNKKFTIKFEEIK